MIERDRLQRECRVFSRYLSQQWPDDYVVEKYLAAHAEGQATAQALLQGGEGRLERVMHFLATVHPLFTRAIDVYSRFFYPDSGVRKRLILLLAILESWAPTYSRLDRIEKAGNRGVIVAGLAVQGLAALVLLLFTVPVLLPLQLMFGKTTV